MDQTIFNWAIAALGTLGGWWMRVMWEEMKELKREDKALADRVAAIDVLVAGQYVKRDHFEAKFESLSHALFDKLDRIEDKLDKKVDKA